MKISPAQRWKTLGLACIGGLAGYLVLNAAGGGPVAETRAAAPPAMMRVKPGVAIQAAASPVPIPIQGKPQLRSGGSAIRVPPPVPPGPAGRLLRSDDP
ncbi:MAG: hypothetical protein JO020_18220 [Chloroflexi bacterium]|nr:hypothetical protein [Chloroflexota bacterium]MBV9896103.1 hypothetical protein [Chloroflexota bacterium]